MVTARETGANGLPVSVVFDTVSDSVELGSSQTGADGDQLPVSHTTMGDGSLVAISRRVAAWESQDGLHWRESALTDSWAGNNVSLLDMTYGDGVWAIGARRRQGRLKTDFVMASRDGIEWQAATFEPDGVGGITELAALGTDGSTLLALGSDRADNVVTQTSSDGMTWSAPQPAEPASFGDTVPRFHRVVSHPDGVFIAGRAGYNTDYRHCYVAGRACDVEFDMVWMAHDGNWLPIETPYDLDASAAALIDDTLYLGGRRASKQPLIATWIPDEPGTIPLVVVPVDEPPDFDAPLADSCSTLVHGTTYAWIGCEGCAQFNDLDWEVESVTENAAEILAESGAVGGTRTIYGTVELSSGDSIEWSIPGYGPIAYLRGRERANPLIGSCL